MSQNFNSPTHETTHVVWLPLWILISSICPSLQTKFYNFRVSVPAQWCWWRQIYRLHRSGGGCSWLLDDPSPWINLFPFIDCKNQSPYFYMQRLTNTIINLFLHEHTVLRNRSICLYRESLRRLKSWWEVVCLFHNHFPSGRFWKNLKNRKDRLPDTFWQLLIVLEWFNTLSVRESLRLFVSCVCKLNMSKKTFAPFQ